MKAASQARRKPALEEIEPRILYAADFSPGLLAAAPSLLGVEHRTLDAGGEFATRQQSTHSTPQQQATRHEVVFVDTATPDYQKFVDDIKAQSGGDRRLDVVLLDPNVDGIKQISATFAGMKDVSAVHIIGHGADGQIDLGRDTLNFDSLLKNASQIKGWGQALTQDADVLIYGCDVAEHADGKALINVLSRLTGADVTASENLTGAADKGGDWILEYQTGGIATALAISTAEQLSYSEVLAPSAEVRSLDAHFARSSTALSGNPVEATRHEIAFIDTRIADYQSLVRSVLSDNSASRQIEVVLLDPNRGGVQQISEVLQQRHGIDAVHLISHGADGEVALGSSELNFDTLLKQATQIKGWGNALSVNADLLIYGCDVAAKPDGAALVNALSRLTGADVAASTDITGNAAQGGNWALEYRTGRIDVAGVFDHAAPQWTGVLAISSNGTITSAATTGAASLTFAHTVAAGSNRALFVEVSIDALSKPVTGITYGGVALTQVGRGAGNHAVEIWSLVAPTVGTANVVVTFSGATAAAAGAVTYNGVNQSTPTGDFGTATGTGTAGSVTVASATGNLVIDAEYWDNNPSGGSVGSGESTLWFQTNANLLAGANSKTGATTVTMSSSVGPSVQWEFAAVSINVAGPNVAPVDTVPAAQSTNEDTAKVFSSGNGNQISITDGDAAGANNEITLSVTNGSLTLAGLTGLTFTAGDGTADATMTFRGTASAINTALNGLSFSPTANYNGGAILTLATKDSVLLSLDIDTGLLGHYTFENTGALGTDTSPAAGYAGTPSGATTANDATRGKVLSLAGAGYIQTTGHFGNPANVTLAAWVNLTTADTSGAEVISLGDSVRLRLDQNAGAGLNGSFYNGSIYIDTTYAVTLAGTGWHHVAFTFNDAGNSAKLYLDGVLVNSTSTTGSISYTKGADSFIGKQGNGLTTADFNGKIDEARVYNRVLTVGEIATLATDLTMTDTGVVAVTVASVNDAPVGTNKTVTTLEDAAYTFTAADFGFTDPSDSPANALLNVKLTTLPGAGTLALSGVAVSAGQFVSVANINAGNLKFTPAANANGAGYAAFTFQVQDDGGVASGGVDLDATARTLTVNVTSVNDAPVGTNKTVTTLEDTAYTFTAADFGFTDPSDSPANALLNVKLTTLPGAGTLALSGVAVSAGQFVSVANINAGNLKFTSAANANGAGYAAFTFQVQDDGGVASGGVDLDATARTLTVNVTSVNDAPMGTNKTVTTLEDTAYSFTAADFGFTDPSDSPANALLNVKLTTLPGAGTLALSGVAVSAGQFVSVANINAGNLKFTPAVNASGAGSASFTFQVQDDGGTLNSGVDLDQSANTMTVNVTAVNDAPSGTNKTVTTLEDAAYTFAAVDFGFTDPIDSSANALSAVKISTIPGTGTLALSGVAVTAGQSITLANITAGNLKFTPAANANGAAYAAFTFQVQDDGGTANGGVDLDQSPNTMTVNVTAVNDPPAGTDKTVTTLEDTAYTFAAVDFGFTDPIDSPANALTAVKISTIPGAGTLALSGVAVAAGQTVSTANIAAGNLKFTPAANANGAAYAGFTFQVQDDGGTLNSGVDLDQSPNTMTVDVTPVNDAPVNTVPAPQGTSEGIPLVFSTGNANQILVGDVDAGSNPVQVTLTATHGVLTLSDVSLVIFGAGDGTADGTMTFTGTLTDINAALNGLTFTPDALYSGAASLTITSNDQGNTGGAVVPLSDSDMVAITVNASTDPTALNDSSYSVDEDNVLNTAAPGVLLNDTSPIFHPLAATLVGGAPLHAASFVLNPDGSFDYTPAADFSGTDSFTYQATDLINSSISNVATVTITVNPVNDAPAGTNNTVTTLEDAAYTFASVDFGFTDPSDSPANALSEVKISGIPGAGTLALSGVAVTAGQSITLADIAAGNLKFTPAANANGVGYAAFTFQVQDDGGILNSGVDLDQSPNIMTIDVTAVNDAPAGTDKTVTAPEDTAYTFLSADFGFSDATDSPANALSAVKITTLPGAGSLANDGVLVSVGDFITAIDIASGKLVFTPVANANAAGYASFTFQVQDNGGTAGGGVDLDQSAKTMTVDVTAVNDAPVLSGSNNLTAVNEDAAVNNGTLVSALMAGQTSDVDAVALTGIAVTAVDDTNGIWQYTTDAGGTWTAFGAPTAASARLLTSDATTLVRFVPHANWNGTVAAGITFLAWDQTTGIAGNTADSTTNGGISAFSAATASASIAVNAVNDPPAGTDKTVATLEDTAYTFTAADFGFSDAADSPANALTAVKMATIPGAGSLTDNGVVLGAGDLVSLADIAAGNLKFTPAANANGVGYAAFTFQVQDDGGILNSGVDLDQSPNIMTIDVTAVNDAPAGTDKTVTAPEDTAYTFLSADFGFSDATDSPANALSAVKITTLPGAGSLANDGVLVSVGDFITAIDIASGKLVFTPVANANAAGYASFTFQVQDNGGTAGGGVDLDQSAKTMTVDVTAVNDAPVLSGSNNLTAVNEDAAVNNGTLVSALMAGQTSDVDAVALTGIAVTAVDDTNGIWQYTTDAGGTWTAFGAPTAASARLLTSDATTLVRFVPHANWNGTVAAGITFLAWDQTTGIAGNTADSTTNGGISAFSAATASASIAVNAVNDPPAGTDKTVATLEDTAYTFAVVDFGFTDPNDSPADTLLAVKITTVPVAGTLTDNGVVVVAGQDVSLSDISTGMLVFTPGANAHAASYASFTFQVQDDGGTASSGVDLDQSPNTMTIDVTVVNDAPAGTNNTITTLEDTAYTFAAVDFGFSDPTSSPANSLLAVEITTLPSAGTLTDNGVAVTAGQFVTAVDIAGGKFIFTPTANANGAGYASFTFQVQDDGGIANGGVDLDPTARVLDINVTRVNDAPAGTDRTVTTLEDSDYVFSASAFGFTDAADAPSDAFFAVRITSLSSAGSLLLSGAAVSAGQMISVASINAGNLVFAPAPNANGAGYASFTFQVQDNGGTANGGVDTDPTARTLGIDVSPVNDAPVLGNNALSVRQGGSVILSDANLSAADIDTPAAGLIFTLSNVLDGQFELVSGRGVAITSFTQANVTAGQVLFVQDGSVNAPAYDVMVSDGTLSVGPRAASIGFSRAPTGAAGGGLLVVPFVPAAPAAASSNALPPAPAPAPAPVVVTRAPPPSAPNAVVVFSGGRVLAADAVRVELPSAIRAFRGVQTTNVPKAIVNAAPTLQPSEAMMMLLIQAADPTSMQFGSGTLREWSAQSAFPADAHEAERDQMKIMMESVEMGGMALSVGVVWWASRITGLISSLIASMPAWSQLDPLHIVGRDKEEEELDEGQDPDADADELAVAMVLEGPQARAGA